MSGRGAIRAGMVLVGIAAAGAARPQDFRSATPPGPGTSPAAFLEQGLAPERSHPALEGAVTSWFGIPDLVTRSLSLGGGWRTLRGAVGLSQTGDPEIGWSAGAVALGAASASGGAALRLAARRDRSPDAVRGSLGPGVGAEAGGGIWVEAAHGFDLWATAPEAWTRGAPPPLDRGLEMGGVISADGISVWLTHEAGARRSSDGHGAGMALRAGPLELWLAARDQPLRGSFGLAARTSGVALAAEIESHPVLGQTTRLALRIGGTAEER
jgi:hypothetical protein